MTTAFKPTHVVTHNGQTIAVRERRGEMGGLLLTAADWSALQSDPDHSPEWHYEREAGMFRHGSRSEGTTLRPMHDLVAGDIIADEEIEALRQQLTASGHVEAAKIPAAALAGDADARAQCTQWMINGGEAERRQLGHDD